MSDLDARLRAAHEAGDGAALVTLYREAAEQAPDDDARAFYLTHAYVFALELGSPHTDALRLALITMGREPAGQGVAASNL
ncbi:hypothetical protein [Roseobacter sinensis]|uniref:Tetratricopeptide repeat protein n=1 Tax=Roseobacter sinensis TaxID=2931391 RepID=A0ABT3BD17_9RHOB|nr:hypothetical protein [Roseobacter sp. WL0113]MCV3271043.1 hypothetical protein [Roseobacter sp. WL0113]